MAGESGSDLEGCLLEILRDLVGVVEGVVGEARRCLGSFRDHLAATLLGVVRAPSVPGRSWEANRVTERTLYTALSTALAFTSLWESIKIVVSAFVIWGGCLRILCEGSGTLTYRGLEL